MNNHGLYVEIQPKQNFHFRYESEIERQGNSHGILKGQQGRYPKIELRLPEEKKYSEFFVLCSLHSFENTKILSPHLLMPNGITELNYGFIFEPMQMAEDNPMKRVFELRDYVIVRLKKAMYNNSFTNKRAAYERLQLPTLVFEELLGPLNLDNPRQVKDSAKLNVS